MYRYVPVLCPVCNGKGAVPPGFYSGNPEVSPPEKCRACGGVGYIYQTIYEPDPPTPIQPYYPPYPGQPFNPYCAGER